LEATVPQRDLASIELPRWGRVVAGDDYVPWLVVDHAGQPLEPVRRYLSDFIACGNRPGSVRAYAYDLLRWWRWLLVVEVAWSRASVDEVRDYVLWLQRATKPRSTGRTLSAATAGTVNLVTGKQYLDDRFKARTIRHALSVVRAFYEFWSEVGEGPLLNPVQLAGQPGRSNAHHNPLQPFKSHGRPRYSPRVPKLGPRSLSDDQWLAPFAALTSNRDRALLSLAVSNGARAAEVLGLRPVDINWGEQLIRVVRKGSQAEQWLPISSEALIWLRLYLAVVGDIALDEPLWRTVRRRDHGSGPAAQPLSYEALRAVFRRANALLGTNWTMHDLRHTAALRMSHDQSLTIRDVQVILGHQHLDTTAGTYLVEEEAEIARRVLAHLAERGRRPATPPPIASGYAAADLQTLLGTVFP
jgi:integrase